MKQCNDKQTPTRIVGEPGIADRFRCNLDKSTFYPTFVKWSEKSEIFHSISQKSGKK